jgi:hypothetical protein
LAVTAQFGIHPNYSSSDATGRSLRLHTGAATGASGAGENEVTVQNVTELVESDFIFA